MYTLLQCTQNCNERTAPTLVKSLAATIQWHACQLDFTAFPLIT